jgi:predicted amidohydrolase
VKASLIQMNSRSDKPANIAAAKDLMERAIAEEHPDLLVLPEMLDWEVLCRARAIETQTYFLAAAQWGGHTRGKETRYSYGHSLIADPWGHVIAKASDGIGSVTARIDPQRVAKVRQGMPVALHNVLEG